jgi:hypothetical protein
MAAVACTAALLICLAGSVVSRSTAAQPRGGVPEVDPRVLAFVKPVELADGDSDLQKKLKERHNAAVRLLDERVKEYRSGVRDASQVFEAARLTAEAKLDLAESAEARRTVLEQTLDMARVIESRLQQHLDNGIGSQGDFQRARYGRLSVEVELLRAQQP